MPYLVKPKHMVIRTKDVDGKCRETHFEDIVYMEVLDYEKQEIDKCVFLVNINGKS